MIRKTLTILSLISLLLSLELWGGELLWRFVQQGAFSITDSVHFLERIPPDKLFRALVQSWTRISFIPFRKCDLEARSTRQGNLKISINIIAADVETLLEIRHIPIGQELQPCHHSSLEPDVLLPASVRSVLFTAPPPPQTQSDSA